MCWQFWRCKYFNVGQICIRFLHQVSSITYQVYFRAGSNQATLNTTTVKASITVFETEG